MDLNPLPKAAVGAPRTRSVTTRASLVDELPRLVRTRQGAIILPRDDLSAFVKSELDVSRLDDIEDRLWLAGRLQNIRTLHRQKLLGRTILPTEQADLHLLWQDDKIFIKPLPAWLLDDDFFQNHVHASPALPAALGFLNSYVMLVSYEVDFILARELHLLPPQLDWKGWLTIVQDLIPNILKNEQTVSPRYHYGELRLSRINWIYRIDSRFRFRHFCRGYYYSSQTYRSFINQNFGWLLVVFVYFTILLTAMQVGLATSQLRDNSSFNSVSYGFTVFSLVVPLLTIIYGAIISIILVIYNVTITLLHVRSAATQQIPRQPLKTSNNKV